MDEAVILDEIREKILKKMNDVLDNINDHSSYDSDVMNSEVIKNLTEAYDILREEI